jgi:hypothetical protein
MRWTMVLVMVAGVGCKPPDDGSKARLEGEVARLRADLATCQARPVPAPAAPAAPDAAVAVATPDAAAVIATAADAGELEPPPPTGRPPNARAVARGAGWWCLQTEEGQPTACDRTEPQCRRRRGEFLDQGERLGPCVQLPQAFCMTGVNRYGASFDLCSGTERGCNATRGILQRTNASLGRTDIHDISDCARFE